ncbi:MAG: cardiolipin synthase [Desulfobacteraceae bacterium]|nr:cardiolipin synthase [Desulfobacteraceae bacterium]MBC2750078.1 cardiolipin synthase [Desulfobacteraceae bacterium]
MEGPFTATLFLLIHVLVQLGFIVRVLLRPHREPASRIAWVLVILAFSVVGIMAYILFGETNLGRGRAERMRAVIKALPDISASSGKPDALQFTDTPLRYAHLFQLGKTINGFHPVDGNQARLLPDSNAAIDAMVADIDAAREHVHLLFYIWLPDNNGCKIVEALKRAAARGVTCRAMADSLGSRLMTQSEHWRSMRKTGVHLGVALAIGNPLLRPLKRRIDLRNHRKIVVVDHAVTYCGSQNCADPEFRIKAKYAPWVDAMIRFEGPIARQNQYLFAADWGAETGEDLGPLLDRPIARLPQGFPAQVIGTGPTVRYSAMPEMFETLMYAARKELVISTPYYVPDEAMQAALCASARRGVDTTIIFPARNDSWVVGAASRSYYKDLLTAGVRIFEYQGGLLHTKSLTVDGEVTLIGSANMDRRSFELNYENNILLYDQALTTDVRQRQASYIEQSRPVAGSTVDSWTWRHRLLNNTIAMLGPVL